MVSHMHLISFFVLLQLIVLAVGTDPYRHCQNAKKPANGNVRCGYITSEDLFYGGGGRSSKSGGRSRSSGSKSKGSDCYSCSFSCNDGYRLVGKSVLQCPFDIEDNPTCELVECETLPRIDHASLDCTNGFRYQSECQYMCAPGFNTTGSNTLTCGSGGFWSDAVPKCQPVWCPVLEEPLHGALSCPTGRAFGADCRYTCDDRYVINGSPVLTCSESGQWMNEPPKCKLGECVPLPFLIHGSITCTNGWDSGSRCFHTCHPGYWRKGGNFVLLCRSNGYWRGNIPTCEKGKPNDPEYISYEQYDGISDPEPLMAGPPNDSGEGSSSQIGTAGIVSIVAVAIILVAVGVGLFVSRRHKKTNNSPYRTSE